MEKVDNKVSSYFRVLTEIKITSQLGELLHSIAKTDLTSQRAVQQIKTLSSEFEAFKKTIEGGNGIANIV